jgi:hypothetical protein
VSVADVEVAHSAEGPSGVLVLLVEAAEADRLHDGLTGHGYRPSVQRLA